MRKHSQALERGKSAKTATENDNTMNVKLEIFDLQVTLEAKYQELLTLGYAETTARTIIEDATQTWTRAHDERAVCKCCGHEIAIEYQPRRVKAPLYLLTCRVKGCAMHDVTITVECLVDFEQRDFEAEGKLTINR
jgi:hypothetical protein